MLSIEECKKISRADLPDEEMRQIRDALYALTESVLDRLLSGDNTHAGDLNLKQNHDIN